jgi:CRP-like cAMP-binding protein/glyoxylase-like metal-dependent hydrolase (beta-lactamase superfamily II)
MKIDKIMPGCFLVNAKGLTFLLGCPSEVVKALKIKGKEMPDTIILSRDGYRGGILQNNAEFPFLQGVFISGNYAKGKKLRIIAEADQLAGVRDNLNLGLTMPDSEILAGWKIPKKVIEDQGRVSRYFSPKRPDGSVVTVEDMAELIPFRNGKVVLDGVEIRVSARNVFTVTSGSESMPVDLNFFGCQPPPVPIETCRINHKRSASGVIALSKCTNGFDPTGYTTGVLLLVNSQPIMVDGVPWTKEHLRALGFHAGEITAHIVSHVHEDHVSITETIVNGQKVIVITTREIFYSFARKIANSIGWTEEKVRSMIIFQEVIPGVPFRWYGATFNFFRTIHTIFCIGFEMEFGGKRFVYSGDTVWGKALEKMLQEGVIDQQQFDIVDRIPRIDADLTIMDAAAGLIHPDPAELELLGKEIYVTHRSSLPEGITNLRTICPGQQWEFLPAKTWDVGDINAVISSPIFSGLDKKWVNAILTSGNILDVYPGQAILQEGSPGKNFYVVLSGTFSVIANEEETAKLGAGDFFGEISIMHGVDCTATVEVIAAGRILEIPKELFLDMVTSTELGEKLRKIHRIRPVLMKCGWMKDLEPKVVNKIVGTTEERHYPAGDKIVGQGELGSEMYVLKTGRVKILIEPNGFEAKSIATLFPGQYFGEMALLGNGKRVATVIAETDVTCLVIKKSDFENLVAEVPALHLIFGTMAEERASELQ